MFERTAMLVTAGYARIVNANLFAGVVAEVTGLPTSSADFVAGIAAEL